MHRNTVLCALCGKQRDAHFNLIWCYAKRVWRHGRPTWIALENQSFQPVSDERTILRTLLELGVCP